MMTAAELYAYRRNRPGPIPHGTVNGYVNYACRCPRCRRANRDKRRAERNRGVALSGPNSATGELR